MATELVKTTQMSKCAKWVLTILGVENAKTSTPLATQATAHRSMTVPFSQKRRETNKGVLSQRTVDLWSSRSLNEW